MKRLRVAAKLLAFSPVLEGMLGVMVRVLSVGVRLVLAASVLFALLAVGPAGSDAASVLFTSPGYFNVEGAAVIGSDRAVVYVTIGRRGKRELHRIVASGRDTVVWREHGRLQGPTVTALKTRIVLLVTDRVSGLGRLLVGPTTGPFRPVPGCAAVSSTESGRLATDGNTVAWPEVPCDQPNAAPRIAVGDLSASQITPTVIQPAAGELMGWLRVAGRWLVYRSVSAGATAFVQRDLLSGGVEVHRITPRTQRSCSDVQGLELQTPSHEVPPTPELCGLAVDSDGSIWELTGNFNLAIDPGSPNASPGPEDRCSGSITRYPLDGGALQTLGAHGCAAPFQVRRGRVLYAPTLDQLSIAETAGATHSLGLPDQVLGFDGQRVIVVRTGCTSQQIVSIDALGSDGPIPPNAFESCPAQFRRARLILGRHPRLVVLVRCSRGCRGPVVAGPVVGPGLTGDAEAHSRYIRLGPGHEVRMTIPIPRRAPLISLARRHHRVRVDFWGGQYVTDPSPPENQINLDLPEGTLLTPVLRGR